VDPLPPSWSVIESPSSPAQDAGARAEQRVATSRVALFLAITIAGIGALAVGGVVAVSSGSTERSIVLPSAAGSHAAASGSGDAIVVEVIGAVRHPGLVQLPADSRVADAIAAAGGFSPAVDTAAVSAGLRLAKPVADGDQVRVPARGDATPRPSAASGGGSNGSAPPGAPIDLNSATEAELDALPGVGPATVAKIVAARTERPFASVDELRDRKIVGAATLAKIRDLVTVR
jgi:competence protein ComEA